MNVTAERLWHRVGRRGCALLFFAVLDFVYALSLWCPPAEAKLPPSQRFIADVAPLWVWALCWLIPGVACAVQAFMRTDKVAFGCAIAIKVVWGTLFIIGGLLFNVDRAYVGATVWLALAAFVAIISTWPEAPIGQGTEAP